VLARTNRLTVAIAAFIAALFAACAIYTATGRAQPARSFCSKTGTGSTASAAIHNYLKRCGRDYRIQKGAFDADKSTSPYASYAQVVEYSLRVTNNAEGGIAFLIVGKRAAGDKWHTLGPPGTGP
jgi:hypothetical protein